MQARLALAWLCSVVLLGCHHAQCDRLGERDGKAWVVMDCASSKVHASVTGTDAQGDFDFSCDGDDEHYRGQYFFGKSSDGVLQSYDAVMNEEDGCEWSRESGGEETCVTVDGKDYPDGCTDSSETTVVYY